MTASRLRSAKRSINPLDRKVFQRSIDKVAVDVRVTPLHFSSNSESEKSMTKATLTNRYTGRTTTLALEPNNWVSKKNYRAALRRISSAWNPTRSNVEFIVYDGRGPCEIVSAWSAA